MFDKVGVDVHVAAGLLKLYLRELPEPLIPWNLHDPLMEVAKLGSYEEMLPPVKELVSMLPLENK